MMSINNTNINCCNFCNKIGIQPIELRIIASTKYKFFLCVSCFNEFESHINWINTKIIPTIKLIMIHSCNAFMIDFDINYPNEDEYIKIYDWILQSIKSKSKS